MPLKLNQNSFIEIEINGTEDESPKLLDVASFLYDFNLLYEIGRLATDERYSNFRFSRYVYFRTGRPLEDKDRLTLELLSHASPTKLKTRIANTAAVLGAIYVLTQTVEKLILLPSQRAKLQEEVRKLRLENDKLAYENNAYTNNTPLIKKQTEVYTNQIHVREADYYIEAVTNRLLRSPVRIEEVEIRVIHEKDLQSKTRNHQK